MRRKIERLDESGGGCQENVKRKEENGKNTLVNTIVDKLRKEKIFRS